MSESNVDFINRLQRCANVSVDEAIRAIGIHGPFNSYHEGYAVLLEEVEELWQEIKHGSDKTKKAAEAMQVAAMALRIMSMACYIDLPAPSVTEATEEGSDA